MNALRPLTHPAQAVGAAQTRDLKPRPLDLVLEVAPDAVHDLAVARVVAQLQPVARAFQRDVDGGLGAARVRGQSQHLSPPPPPPIPPLCDEPPLLPLDP